MPEAGEAPVPEPRPDEGGARFVSGSILRHVVVMSATGSVGLMAIFAVDLLSLFYVSKLGDPALTAAVGFASIVQFFAIAINIGLMIAAGALVSRAIGSNDPEGARRIATSVTIHCLIASGILAAFLIAVLDPLLRAIGAEGHTLDVAKRYLWISLPSNLLLGPGMLFTGLLRAVGAAREAMYVTLGGAVVTVFVDPLLIFGFGLGVDGAALAVCVARVTFVAVGWAGVRRYRLLEAPRLRAVLGDLPLVSRIAGPAVLTNLAPSVASAFVAHALSGFGPPAIAGNVVIERLAPVAFCGLFAMSGSIGPILGQNWGAARFDRMRGVLRAGAGVTALYVVVVWLLLALARSPLAGAFELKGVSAELFGFFCLVSGPVWFFNGLLFLANASFNNLGFPFISTVLNWGRATLGTVPPALLGAAWYGPEGVIAGTGIGSIAFGVAGLALAFRTVGRLERGVSTEAGPVLDPPAADEAVQAAPSSGMSL
ncbi:MATE family efflux transporter [Methylorubrum rhodesianum]|uniref:MATE family efflux transporter n=1 Tax=Methylorubrum TaxID=2282523 RepID=UPI00160F5D79|nr:MULTISPECIES: MATE family efflux transporter [Methylorubrum]MBB5761334.1 putative MATE family efflux protein [Methylorubrum rhodesianum]MBI1688148.1 MATE family efflux transporter [Methylorubrum sp. DB1722]